jgi:hypothetical protein
VSECERKVSIMRKPWPTGGGAAVGSLKTKIVRAVDYVHNIECNKLQVNFLYTKQLCIRAIGWNKYYEYIYA